MHQLTREQQNIWSNELLHGYFPHVCRFPIEKFQYLRFAEREALHLPSHLQFFNDAGEAELEIDIPKILEDRLFIKHIDDGEVEYLKSKVLDDPLIHGRFNITEYLVRRKYENSIRLEEARFSACFTGVGTYEDIPDLFLKKFDNHAVLVEYDSENDSFTFDFTELPIIHSTDDIIRAYQCFAHAVYNLRTFGVARGIADTNLKELADHFFNHLENTIPFYAGLLHTNTDDAYFAEPKNSKNPQVSDKVQQSGNLLEEYPFMVYYELETITSGTSVYVPTNTTRLLTSISNKSNKKWLLREKSKSEISDISDGEKQTIRDIFTVIFNMASSPKVSQRAKDILNSGIDPRPNKGKFQDKLWALREFFSDSDNQFFLSEPSNATILKPYIEKVDDFSHRLSVSLDRGVTIDDEEDEIPLGQTIEDKTGKITSGNDDVEVKVIMKISHEEICDIVERSFPLEKTEFVQEIILEIESSPPNKLVEADGKPKQYFIDKLLVRYEQYHGCSFHPAWRKQIEKEFRKIMRKILCNIIDIINQKRSHK